MARWINGCVWSFDSKRQTLMTIKVDVTRCMAIPDVWPSLQLFDCVSSVWFSLHSHLTAWRVKLIEINIITTASRKFVVYSSAFAGYAILRSRPFTFCFRIFIAYGEPHAPYNNTIFLPKVRTCLFFWKLWLISRLYIMHAALLTVDLAVVLLLLKPL